MMALICFDAKFEACEVLGVDALRVRGGERGVSVFVVYEQWGGGGRAFWSVWCSQSRQLSARWLPSVVGRSHGRC